MFLIDRINVMRMDAFKRKYMRVQQIEDKEKEKRFNQDFLDSREEHSMRQRYKMETYPR